MKLLKRVPFFLLVILTNFAQGQSFAISDTFDDNRNNWWVGESGGGTQAIRDGKLYTNYPDGGWTIQITPYVAFEKDFVMEASFRQTAGVDNYGVGLMWGYDKTDNDDNSFKVALTGYYYISTTKMEEGKSRKGIGEWVKTDLIKPMGQANLLKVEQKSGSLIFYINGTKVTSVPMLRWHGSGIGIVASAKMNVETDNFKFRQDGLFINLPPNLTKGFVKENLGPGVNTAADDLMPRIAADGKTLYFGREYYEGNVGGVEDGEDFYVSVFDGKQFGPAVNMGSPVNGKSVDNISSVSTDNNTLLYGNSGSFTTRSRTESGWGEPVEIGVNYVNEAKHFESCLSADGKAILFVAQNSNNIWYNKNVEDRDIYVSTQNLDGTWTSPINLGRVVNTRTDEVSPFLAADGRTLYFSTDGRPGYGGSDIFMTKRIGDGWTNWSEPVNLGPEINTSAFDAYYVIPASGDYAYMVTALDGYGKSDIVRIKLAKELKPEPVVLVRGKTLDAKTKKPISADVLVDNLTKEVGEANSDPTTGAFQIVLPYGSTYGFHAAAQGYLSVNENLELVTVNTYTEMEKDLFLVPIRVGETIQLNNVFFEQAKAILKPDSYPELDRLVTIMKENPTMEIELGGYTDNIGRAVALTVLSIDRVGTVKKYMVDKGIQGKRITGKGYGPENPIVKNDTEEHRRMNRRVEFKVTKK